MKEIDLLPVEQKKKNRLQRLLRRWAGFVLAGIIVTAMVSGMLRGKVSRLIVVADELERQLKGIDVLTTELSQVEKQAAQAEQEWRTIQRLMPPLDVVRLLTDMSIAAGDEVTFQQIRLSRVTGDTEGAQYQAEVELLAPSTAEATALITRLQTTNWCKSVELLFSNTAKSKDGMNCETARLKLLFDNSRTDKDSGHAEAGITIH